MSRGDEGNEFKWGVSHSVQQTVHKRDEEVSAGGVEWVEMDVRGNL